MRLEQILPLLREKGGKVKVTNRLMWGAWDFQELKKQLKYGERGWSNIDPFNDDIFEYAPPLKEIPQPLTLCFLSLKQLGHVFACYAGSNADFAGFATNFGFKGDEVRHWMENPKEYKS